MKYVNEIKQKKSSLRELKKDWKHCRTIFSELDPYMTPKLYAIWDLQREIAHLRWLRIKYLFSPYTGNGCRHE